LDFFGIKISVGDDADLALLDELVATNPKESQKYRNAAFIVHHQ